MGQTPAYNLPYPEDADPPNGPAQIRALAEQIESVLAGQAVVPVGTIAPYGGDAAPAGWLLCDGGAISRATYAALFAIIGERYGAGDGSTTFNKPNFRGVSPVGLDAGQAEFNALGKKGGAKTHVLTAAEMPAHAHGVSDPGHGHGVSDPTHAHAVSDPGHSHGSSFNSFASANGTVSSGAGTARQSVTGQTGVVAAGTGIGIYGNGTGVSIQGSGVGVSIQNAGGGAGHPNLPPYLVVNFVVKT